ncbi:hypothetical protein [Sunxiuqinia elliptica]|uniref:Uncharacterized protein n=1 Tax=Sunxiuqinia elliptica TaxID=655355 RepID=A0A4R6GYL6_9BACT|nr:hypothetical protein [Sunxiuqinia elliptica]TDN99954.1 hypothetical protein DET52_106167 [Sunxiuqinia elliptica]TDO57146.1 hypothetical protein DET65_3731 [Sunxiuqinia elliptica]
MKRGNLFKILNFAKIPVILAGVFLVLKWLKGTIDLPAIKNKLFPHWGANPLIFDPEIAAKRQQDAMMNWGTDEELLFNSLEHPDGKPFSGKQLKQVFEAFGFRDYDFTGGRNVFLGAAKNLFEWYESELTRKEKVRMRAIWEKSGLDLTF